MSRAVDFAGDTRDIRRGALGRRLAPRQNRRRGIKLCIVNTGGTISSVGQPLGPMTAAEFGEAGRRLLDPIVRRVYPDTELVYETGLTFPTSSNGMLDSTNLQPSDWCRIAGFLLERYDRYDGFVVLHGTDSMDFTGAALPFY